MPNRNLEAALAYQEYALEWIGAARRSDDYESHLRMLAIADEWLCMAEEAMGEQDMAMRLQ